MTTINNKQIRLREFDFKGQRVTVGVLKSSERNETRPPLVEVPRVVGEFNMAHGTDTRIIRPSVADHLIVGGFDEDAMQCYEFWKLIMKCGDFPTNELVIYEAPGVPFGDRVFVNQRIKQEDRRCIFEVPENLRSIVNGVLVVSEIHADDFVKDGKDVLVHISDGSRIRNISDFPLTTGQHYEIDPESTVTFGPRLPEYWTTSKPNMFEHRPVFRCPWRNEKKANVTSVTRQAVIDGVYKGIVFMTQEPLGSGHYGVGIVVEVPYKDVEKLKALD
ncbi:MAG: hypothetical protein Q7S22_07510 [Candidatus Micrarchaeota archaeon]|nr:hypothetical protein [Candidatus Micrarchaeota archaeon]